MTDSHDPLLDPQRQADRQAAIESYRAEQGVLVAVQRKADEAQALLVERERAIEQGRSEERVAAHTAEQDRLLAAISGSVAAVAGDVKLVTDRISAVEISLAQSVAVTAALAEKGVSNKTMISLAAGIIIPLLALIVAVVTSLH